jgi:hypothetical protein
MKKLEKESYGKGLREGFIRHTMVIRADYYHVIAQEAAKDRLMLTDMVDEILTAWIKSLKRKKPIPSESDNE